MNPLEEARARLDGRYEVMVLEPSPPTVENEPFTDDPTALFDPGAGRTLVAPIDTGIEGDITWDALARDDTHLASWCAVRALGAWLPPPPLPPTNTFTRTRLSMHALAEHVLCPARYLVNGKIGLRYTRHGFGTPFFGADEQVRVEGTMLVHDIGSGPEDETFTDLTTLGAAAAAIDIEPGAPDLFTPATPLDLNRPLDLDPGAVAVIGWWFGFAASALAQLRADEASNVSASPPSLIQLWPEHFDLAVDLGDTAAGQRANFGASPGDALHPEPYLYIGPWEGSRLPASPDAFWNEPFGASLPYSSLLGSGAGAREAALAFFRAGRARLES